MAFFCLLDAAHLCPFSLFPSPLLEVPKRQRFVLMYEEAIGTPRPQYHRPLKRYSFCLYI